MNVWLLHVLISCDARIMLSRTDEQVMKDSNIVGRWIERQCGLFNLEGRQLLRDKANYELKSAVCYLKIYLLFYSWWLGETKT